MKTSLFWQPVSQLLLDFLRTIFKSWISSPCTLQFGIFISIYTYRNTPQERCYAQSVLFASFITVRIYYFFVFSPTTRSTFQLFLELRDAFTGKKRFFHAFFSERISQQPRILIVTGVKSSLNTRESFSQVAWIKLAIFFIINKIIKAKVSK